MSHETPNKNFSQAEKWRQVSAKATPEHSYRPVPTRRNIVKLTEDIVFERDDGIVIRVEAGSYLNITNPKRIYGISVQDFADTYAVVDSPKEAA